MNKQVWALIRHLRENCRDAYVGSVDENGFPQIKAMFVTRHGDLRHHYFSTNTSSLRAEHFRKNPNACVYYCDNEMVAGALFTGAMEVCTDPEHKQMLWNEGDERYYPKGVTDEDYCVFKFTAETIRFYHGGNKLTLSIDELCDLPDK